MTMSDRWLDEGLDVLTEKGANGLRVDRIAERLLVTKGSFHHHFAGVGDYRRSVLARYESEAMAAISSAVEAVDGLAPEQALQELPAHVLFHPRREAAVRSWAFENDEASATQARVDAARLEALVGLWEQILPDDAQTRTAALVPHLVTIGASVVRPMLTEQDVRDVLALLARLVPAAGESGTPPLPR